MNLPDFSRLSLAPSNPNFTERDVISATRDRWLKACGTRPTLKRWKNMRGQDKYRLLHRVAAEADDDTDPDGDYLTAYEQMDIDDVLARKLWSVEHVVPRSHINGSGPGPGENDPNGWIVATRDANSRRNNYPLYLWRDPPGKYAPPNRLVRVDGQLHYVPPTEQRGRLARKWLFIRATYADDTLQPPTKAQINRRNEIIALAKYDPIYDAERLVNAHYRSELGWANPLLEEGANKWYDDVGWRNLVFGL